MYNFQYAILGAVLCTALNTFCMQMDSDEESKQPANLFLVEMRNFAQMEQKDTADRTSCEAAPTQINTEIAISASSSLHYNKAVWYTGGYTLTSIDVVASK